MLPISGSGGDEAADDDIFFQAFELIFLAADGCIDQDSCGFLEGCCGEEA